MIVSADALAAIEYPEEGDLPMLEGDAQSEYLSYASQVLRIFFQACQDVYEKGNNKASVAS
jgi:hypothetical protein